LAIFKEREKLSPRYLPSNLLHREKQMQEITNYFKDSIADPSKAFLKPLQIIGPSGTGKTSTVLRFGERFVAETDKNGWTAKHVYVNLKLQGGSRVILYRNLLEKATPEVYSSSLSAEEMLRSLLRQLAESKKYLLISLDEVDYFIKSTKETRIIYDLTRLNEVDLQTHCNVVGVIFVARSKEFHEKLDPVESSSLGRIAVEFRPYTSREILDILTQRASEAILPTGVSEPVLRYIADLTVTPPANGDLRYALDMLLYAGMLAESQGVDSITSDHVRTVYGEGHPAITEEDILNLPKKEHLATLLAIVRSLRGNAAPYVSLKTVRSDVMLLSEEKGLAPFDDVEEYVQDLSDRGLVEVRSFKEIGILGEPGENLENYLDSLLRRIEDGLDGY
jgi:cell division control protein 6